MTISGLPTGLSASPSSFTLQSSPQNVTLTADQSMATGTYSFTLSGTSGNHNHSLAVNVGVGPIQTFRLLTLGSLEAVVTFGSTDAVSVETQVCCPPGPDDYSINFSLQGLPAGVTANFSPNPISPGRSTTMTLTAPANGQWLQNLPITVVATPTVPVPTQDLSLDLVVAPPPGNLPPNRSDYLRTDDTPQWIVYDQTHQLIFASEYYLNRVDVVSATSRQFVASIPVFNPRGMALTLDGSEVLVASDAQQMSAIDTASLQIVQQWKLPRIGGQDYNSRQLYPLSNGTVAVQILQNYQGQLAIWDPSQNTMSPVTLPPSFNNSEAYVFGAGTKVIVATSFVSNSQVAIYDANKRKFGTPITFPQGIFGVAGSPDGSHFIIFDEVYGINLYNDQLQQTGAIPAVGYISGFIFSSDASRIYVAGTAGVPVIFVCDGTSGVILSTAPALGTIPPGSQIVPSPFVETPFAIDATGIIFGSADHGIAFDDSTYSVNYQLGFNSAATEIQTVTPNSGPVDVATTVSFGTSEGFSFTPDVWCAGVRGTGAELAPGSGALSFTTPALSEPGPVNVKIIQPDGTQIFDPLIYSYGPSILFVNRDTASPGGGVTSDIIGLGLPADPGEIQVTVGGKNASVVSAKPVSVQSLIFPESYPYPAVDVQVNLPPGNGDQDVQITTSAGSTTVAQGIHYVESLTDFASADKIQAVLFDRKRNQVYLSAGDYIDVFSVSAQQFVATIFPPALNGQKNFFGMAMTPDGSKLLVANAPDGSLAIINPDQPNSAVAVQIVPPGRNPGPQYVAATNTGKAFIGPSSDFSTSIYELDLSTLQVTGIYLQQFYGGAGALLSGSGDGSKILGISDLFAIYDSASGSWITTTIPINIGYNATVSYDGSVFAPGAGFIDSSGDLMGYLAWQDIFQFGIPYSVPLQKISDDGSLLFVPYPAWTDGLNVHHQGFVDIYDVNRGILVHRISLAEQIQQVTDAMAIDQTGKNIYLITNAGLTAIQLGSGFPRRSSVSANSAAAWTDPLK